MDNKKKWNIGWGTVSTCNMNCEFCYSKFKRNTKSDLGLKEWIDFVDSNHEHIKSINYGTGENSMSDDWYLLVQHIHKNYPTIKQALTTNGYISEVIKRDSEKKKIIIDGIDEFDISLDFANAEKHNKFRGQSNAYKWAMETLEFCNINNKITTIVCLGSSKNAYYENIDELLEIAATYNAKLRINLYRPTEGINNLSKKYILHPEDLVYLIKRISLKHRILSISDVLFSNLLTDKNESDPSGIDSIRVLPNGNITPSTYLIEDKYIVGNIRDKNVLGKLDFKEKILKKIYTYIPKSCSNCMYVEKCRGGVYDRRYLWYGTLEYKDPYCLYEPGDSPWEKLEVDNLEFQSVHYGYLPTMFFLPNKN